MNTRPNKNAEDFRRVLISTLEAMKAQAKLKGEPVAPYNGMLYSLRRIDEKRQQEQPTFKPVEWQAVEEILAASDPQED